MSDPIPPTTAIADVLQLRGATGWLSPPLRPVHRGSGAVSGPARTVRFAPGAGPEGLAPVRRLLDSDLTGGVLVLAGAHHAAGAVWGEILTAAARNRGALAVLVEGSVRDIAGLAAFGLPIWALDEATVGPGAEVHVAGVGEPVTVAGVPVAEGDLVVVDPGGVVALASGEADAVWSDAVAYAEAESRTLAALEAGGGLGEAYAHKAAAVAALRDRTR